MDESKTLAVHPGEKLKERLTELDVKPTDLAIQIGVPPNRISLIIAGKRSITGDTALRLGHWFGENPKIWLELQNTYDLRIAHEERGGEINQLRTHATEDENADANGMKPDDLWRTYPLLYHMAWDGSWPSIREYGLLSTAELLREYGKSDNEIRELTQKRRPHWVTIETPGRPRAVIRDQKPLTDGGLRKALKDGMPKETRDEPPEPWQWYEKINSMVFFWPTRNRLRTLMTAAAYDGLCHDVLIVDTKKLVELVGDKIRLSHINSGSTRPFPHPRNLALFQPIKEFPFQTRMRKLGKLKAVAEVCVNTRVDRIEEAVINVMRGSAEEILAKI